MDNTLNLKEYLRVRDISDYIKEFDSGGAVYHMDVYGLQDVDLELLEVDILEGDID